jgi:hypothetical protein
MYLCGLVCFLNLSIHISLHITLAYNLNMNTLPMLYMKGFVVRQYIFKSLLLIACGLRTTDISNRHAMVPQQKMLRRPLST